MSARSPGSDGKNFRIYVRHELVVALVNESSLQLDPQDWQMPALESTPAEDELAMHMMWLAGNSINLVYDRESGADGTDLMDRLQSWYDQCPPTFRGAVYGKVDEEGLRKVFFAVPAAGMSEVAARGPVPRFTCFQRLTTLQEQRCSGITCLA